MHNTCVVNAIEIFEISKSARRVANGNNSVGLSLFYHYQPSTCGTPSPHWDSEDEERKKILQAHVVPHIPRESCCHVGPLQSSATSNRGAIQTNGFRTHICHHLFLSDEDNKKQTILTNSV